MPLPPLDLRCRQCDHRAHAPPGARCPVDGHFLVGATHDALVGRELAPDLVLFDVLSDGGGFSRVYRAVQLRLAREVVVKVLRPQQAEAALGRARFLQEARLLADLGDEPRVVTVHDCGEVGDLLYLVLARAPGEALSARLRDGPLPEAAASALIHEVLRALSAVHARGQVHRDLKPDNIIVQGPALTPRVTLIDFGIAKLLNSQEDSPRTATDVSLGTPRYMAPEQLQAGGEVGPWTDVYAAGVLLFELLVGHPPFEGSAAQLVGAHLYQPPPEAPGRLGAVVARALAKQPQDRYPDAAAMAEALAESAQPAERVELSPTLDAVERAAVGARRTDPHRRKRPAWLWAVPAALAAAALAWLIAAPETLAPAVTFASRPAPATGGALAVAPGGGAAAAPVTFHRVPEPAMDGPEQAARGSAPGGALGAAPDGDPGGARGAALGAELRGAAAAALGAELLGAAAAAPASAVAPVTFQGTPTPAMGGPEQAARGGAPGGAPRGALGSAPGGALGAAPDGDAGGARGAALGAELRGAAAAAPASAVAPVTFQGTPTPAMGGPEQAARGGAPGGAPRGAPGGARGGDPGAALGAEPRGGAAAAPAAPGSAAPVTPDGTPALATARPVAAGSVTPPRPPRRGAAPTEPPAAPPTAAAALTHRLRDALRTCACDRARVLLAEAAGTADYAGLRVEVDRCRPKLPGLACRYEGP